MSLSNLIANLRNDLSAITIVYTDKKICLSKRIPVTGALILLSLFYVISVDAQTGQGSQYTTNKADQRLRGGGRINPSTLGMEIEVPIGSSPGRGSSLPVGLNYSSKQWRLKYLGIGITGNYVFEPCVGLAEPKFAETSASGWTTTLAQPYVEYTGETQLFNSYGNQTSEPCEPGLPGDSTYFWVRRIHIHLSDGSTHELRADDSIRAYASSSNCVSNNSNTCDPNDPYLPQNKNGWFYAVDGSKLKYYEDSGSGIYRIWMPDGSYYDLSGSREQSPSNDLAEIRKASQYTDRNGNRISFYNDQPNIYPNGYWKDTMGRNIGVPLPLTAPAAPMVQDYSMPGMSGVYKFYWKKLKGNTAETSAVTDFINQSLNYAANRSNINSATRTPSLYTNGAATGGFPTRVIDFSENYFNPVVLSAIELPTGQFYKFFYNVYGEIEQVQYPTGGMEKFNYINIESLESGNNVYTQANRGVDNRKIYLNAEDTTPVSEWNYGVTRTNGSYSVRTDAPDGTRTERFLYFGGINNNWGYGNILSGLPIEERVSKISTGQIFGKTVTNWQVTTMPANNMGISVQWHPRSTQEDVFSFEANGSGITKRTTYEYDGDPNALDATMNLWKTTQYAFVNVAPGFALAPTPCPNGDPPPCGGPSPTPTPTPLPSASPVRIIESTYLVNDGDIDVNVRNAYRARNMNGLVTKTAVKTGGGQTVAETRMNYDETAPLSYGVSPSGWVNPGVCFQTRSCRGNPTSTSKWLNTNNTWQTAHAQFDQFGNPILMEDARGKKTWLEYSAAFQYAFATKTTTSVPDSTGTTGTSTALTSSSDFDFDTGLVKSTTDSNAQITTLSYKDDNNVRDPLNRLRKVTNPDGSWTKYSFGDTLGNLYTMTESPLDSNRTVKSYAFFDGLGRSVRSFTSEGVNSYIVSDTQYDQMGRVWRVSSPYRNTGDANLSNQINPSGEWTTTEYDDLSRPKKVTLADDTFIQTSYTNNVTIATDQAQRQRRQIVNSLGQMVRIDEPDPSGDMGTLSAPKQPTSFEYDGLGNIVHIAQNYDIPNNRQGDNAADGVQHRYFKFDSFGRILYERHVEQDAPFAYSDPVTGNGNWSRKFVYDIEGKTGLLAEMYDARNVRTKYTYDNIDRITKIEYSDGTTPTVNKYYDQGRSGYFNRGRLTEVSTAAIGATPKTSQIYNFDIQGRVAGHRQVIGDKTYPTSYEYNLGGQLVSEQYPSGRVVKTNYNNAGQISSVTAPNGFPAYLSGVTYTAHGAIASETLGNGIAANYIYNERFQVTDIAWQRNGAQIERYAYKYGQLVSSNGTVTVNEAQNNGQLARVENWIGTDKQYEQRFSYDGLGRLTNSTEIRGDNGQTAFSQTFGYDVFGNRFYRQNQNANNPVSQAWTEDTDINKAKNRFIYGINYDAQGNIQTDSKFRFRQYQYDANGRQKSSVTLDNYTIQEQTVYDGLGQRVVNTVGQITRHIVYDAFGKQIAEYDNAPPAQAQTKYLLTDKSGSVRVTTDAQGNVISRQDYAVFGEEIYSGVGQRTTAQGFKQSSYINDPNNDKIRQGFNGLEDDEATGLTHTLWRKYDSSSGRWTSPDPYGGSLNISNPQSYNRYSYVENDPANLTDTSGLISSNWGYYSAEYANEADYNERHGFVDEAMDFYYQRWAPQQAERAQALLDNGFVEEAKAIVDSNPYLIYEDGSEGEVTVTATVDPPVDADTVPFVISNPASLIQQAIAGTNNGYHDDKEVAQCALLPLGWENQQEGLLGKVTPSSFRNTTNWVQGAAITDGMNLKQGTVLASGWVNKQYLSKPSGSPDGNHTVVFDRFGEQGGVRGMFVVEQLANSRGKPKHSFKPFDSRGGYFGDAGAFNVVMLRTNRYSPNPIDNNLRRTIMR